jgi:hypothetical protein
LLPDQAAFVVVVLTFPAKRLAVPGAVSASKHNLKNNTAAGEIALLLLAPLPVLS